MSNHEHLDNCIEEARHAARQAGIDPGTATWDLDGELVRPNASYAFELEGIEDGPQLTDIAEALEALPGVSARLVYPTKMAWVTAPASTPLVELTDTIESFGVTATVTDSTLQRRAHGRYWQEHPMPRRAKHRRNEEANLLARAQGFVRPVSRRSRREGDVLFTARDLVTPTRLVVAVLLTIPVLLLTYIPSLDFPGWQWVCFALATPVALWCASPFHRAMAGGVRRGISALDGASSIAILASYVWSFAMLLFTSVGDIGYTTTGSWMPLRMSDSPELYFEVSCTVTTLLLFGRYFSMQVRTDLREELESRRPGAEDVYNVDHRDKRGTPSPEALPATEIRRGDDVTLTAGHIIPVDGEVVGGSGRIGGELVDTHRDQILKVGSIVTAGSVLASGEIKVRAARVGHTTLLAAVQRWLDDASRHQNAATMVSTRSAGLLIPTAYVIAVLNFGLWLLFNGNINTAAATSLAILVVVAPVSLAISPALAMRQGLDSAVRHGMLVRDGNALRTLADTDMVVFNRVGTLVKPEMHVETVTAVRGESTELVLRIAGVLSADSDHPASKAIVKAARGARDARSGDPRIPDWIEANGDTFSPDGEFGGPITATWGTGENARSETFAASLWRPTNLSQLHGKLSVAATTGGTPVVVRWGGRDRGVITLYDPAKDDAIQAIDRLESMGVETVMLTRDTYPVARRFADFLGISQVLAGIHGLDKPHAVRALHTQGSNVAMVGDASVLPTLRVADSGILFAEDDLAGTKEPRWSDDAEVVLIREDVMSVPQLIEHAQRVKRIANSNLAFAVAYNATAVVLAAAGALPPVGATLLMLGSSLFIEAKSRRARRFKI
ncbi:ATPase, P-type (transporting), HAD superfamily, subfamily IC [Corynebacterium coyleae]|uniref:HAD family hydrolase n=1 Tax=Corynebacterium coyleae TaxID=53374 RepID=A0ABX8KUB1_9CORY|nr:HAD family hydrolase [Corynebacterium coyleae]QXB17513.1 HAD family hydrolase [Corynebacterium coyleae]WJY78883.1 putative copper-exporting P-type ATPase V [Corynebacterium coyleae]SEB60337.1 ATPase, P-type (transporting), HAD superfamily, subfamily IC [Corynebacterium coyleae]